MVRCPSHRSCEKKAVAAALPAGLGLLPAAIDDAARVADADDAAARGVVLAPTAAALEALFLAEGNAAEVRVRAARELWRRANDRLNHVSATMRG